MMEPLWNPLQAPLVSPFARRLQTGSVPPPPFAPGDLFSSGQQGAWYDPSDVTTLFQDTGAVTPVTAPGDPVRRINDKSGNGNHLLAIAGIPTYQVVGGKPCIRGDGSAAMQRLVTFTGSDQFASAMAVNTGSKPGGSEYWFCLGNTGVFSVAANYLSGSAGSWGGLYVDGGAGSIDAGASDVGLDYALGHTVSLNSSDGRVTVDSAQTTLGGSAVTFSALNVLTLFCAIFGSGAFGLAPGDFYGGILRVPGWDASTDLQVHAWLAAKIN